MTRHRLGKYDSYYGRTGTSDYSASLPPEVGGPVVGIWGASGPYILGKARKERRVYHRTRTTCIVFSLWCHKTPQYVKAVVLSTGMEAGKKTRCDWQYDMNQENRDHSRNQDDRIGNKDAGHVSDRGVCDRDAKAP